jgi:hypothetical protein
LNKFWLGIIAIAKVVLSPSVLFGMVQRNSYKDRGKTISTMGMIDFGLEKNSNNFSSIKGFRYFPRVGFIFEQSFFIHCPPPPPSFLLKNSRVSRLSLLKQHDPAHNT